MAKRAKRRDQFNRLPGHEAFEMNKLFFRDVKKWWTKRELKEESGYKNTKTHVNTLANVDKYLEKRRRGPGNVMEYRVKERFWGSGPDQNVSVVQTPDETTFLEGEQRAAKSTVRNPQLRKAAKKKWGLKCYCCNFDFEAFYGGVARGLAIVHHLQLFDDTKGKAREATVNEVRVVCANCHYVIHVANPPIDVDALKRRISECWTSWSETGVTRK